MRKYLLHILVTIYVKSSVVSDMSMISSHLEMNGPFISKNLWTKGKSYLM